MCHDNSWSVMNHGQAGVGQPITCISGCATTEVLSFMAYRDACFYIALISLDKNMDRILTGAAHGGAWSAAVAWASHYQQAQGQSEVQVLLPASVCTFASFRLGSSEQTVAVLHHKTRQLLEHRPSLGTCYQVCSVACCFQAYLGNAQLNSVVARIWMLYCYCKESIWEA